MKMEEKNMDKAIREKLDGFSQQPPLHVWDNIQGQLQGQRRKRRIAFFSRIAAAAVVLLAFLAGWFFSEKSVQTESVITKTEISQPQNSIEEKIASHPKNEETLAEMPDKIESKNNITKKNILKIKLSQEDTTDFLAEAEIQHIFNSQERVDATPKEDGKALNLLGKIEALLSKDDDNELILREQSVFVSEITKEDEALIVENVRNLKSSDKEDSKWKLGLQVSPGYSSQSSSYSEAYSNSMTYSGQNGNANVTGGISVQMKAGKKWSIESGVYYSQNGQRSTNSKGFHSDMMASPVGYTPLGGERKSYFNTVVNLSNGQIAMNSTAGTIRFSSAPAGTEVGAGLEEDGLNASPSPNTLLTEGEFSQVFDFVEVPLYLRYSLIDAKFGVDILGGINAGFIAGNNVYMENRYGNQNIGTTKDISTLNFSGTFGIGLNYALNKNISVAVEPRFSYYLNSINQNPDVSFRPYRIGVYTGLYYEF